MWSYGRIWVCNTGVTHRQVASVEQIVEAVNKELLPYKRIRKVFVVDEPLEMTSTKKIKRFAVAKKYKEMINA